MSIANDWLKLRLAVGYLGEKAQENWWTTSFYESSSRLFLEPTFPKTSYLVQYHGVCEAARQSHDARIGLGNAFHLFRLPAELEQDLHNALQVRTGGDTNSPPENVDAALKLLSSFALTTLSQKETVKEGPFLVGTWEPQAMRQTLTRVAGAYQQAFRHSKQVFPYLIADS